MAYVHHANYAIYLEEARMDLFRCYGLDVVKLEREGVILPVVSLEVRYLAPLRFGDRITVQTTLLADTKIKLDFKYKIFNQDQKLLASAKTCLVFTEKNSGKLIRGFQKYLGPLTELQREV